MRMMTDYMSHQEGIPLSTIREESSQEALLSYFQQISRRSKCQALSRAASLVIISSCEEVEEMKEMPLCTGNISEQASQSIENLVDSEMQQPV
jgi:hypothetical protein